MHLVRNAGLNFLELGTRSHGAVKIRQKLSLITSLTSLMLCHGGGERHLEHNDMKEWVSPHHSSLELT